MNVSAAGAVLDAGVADGLWPGVVAAVGVGDEELERWVLGSADTTTGRPMHEDTVFDLASLTKVLATTPLILQLVRTGRVQLAMPLRAVLPKLLDPRVTVERLLTHTSGLPAHVRFAATNPAELVGEALWVALESEPGTRVTYSDVGFILLAGLLGSIDGRVDSAFERKLAGPLGVSARFRPPASWRDRIAATEVYDGVPTLGVVHDENAQLAGGVAGHAGLFGTLADVLGLMRVWRKGGPVLTDKRRREAMRDHTAGLGGHRGHGWTCRGDGYDILSPGWGGAAVSHTGFTGTSVALDPATGRWAVLLTNHVHFGRGRPEVFAARRRWHAALVGD